MGSIKLSIVYTVNKLSDHKGKTLRETRDN